jgi:cytidylate kinase
MSAPDHSMPPEGLEFLESLQQAFARQSFLPQEGQFQPLSLTVAVSREAGSRGGTIARRVGKKLGWQVYNQELLEYLAQEKHLGRELLEALDEPAGAWVEERLQQLVRAQTVSQNASMIELARVILSIGARGEAVILGRGAGCLLPPESTLHVRVIAPLADRISYMRQLERLTVDKAAEQVELRDRSRGEFVETHFHRKPADIYQYDLLVNSSLLGEDLSAQLIARAAKAKLSARGGHGAPSDFAAEPLA